MVLNPLFPGDDEEPKKNKGSEGFTLQNRKGRTLHPVSQNLRLPPHAREETPPRRTVTASNPAVELIRRKLDAIYDEEPNAKAEIAEVTAEPAPERSKHQQFMYQLSVSGKSLAEIQTDWHNYYVGLPDSEKHEVWREFYANNARQASAYNSLLQKQTATAGQPPMMPGFAAPARPSHYNPIVSEHTAHLAQMPGKGRSKAVAHIKKKVVNRVLTSASAQEKAKRHFQSLAFGLGTGFLVLLIFLFGFFNEMFIAPFIQPSRHVSATPIILSSDGVAPSDTPEIIIPKINVQIPVVYDEPSVAEAAVQKALERGVIHYATTVNPGQLGNTAIFGHSSNNLFNKGQYKFAFVLLHKLVPGDIFYLTYDKKVYTYRVFDRKVVTPSEVAVLNNVADKPATATLITCDPPGTSTNRLVVWGEQISPDPTTAAAPAEVPTNTTDTPSALPSEGPTLWSRFWNWVF